MAQLIVTVKRLYKRTIVPAVLPDPTSIIGVVEEGFQFEGVPVAPEEILNPALGSWYRDRDGHVYWGGGLALSEMPSLLEAAPAAVPYAWWMQNQVYSIPELWDGQQQANVKIAILDTGLNPHVDFKFENITGFNFLDNTDTYKTDPHGHGTHLAGIIAAQGVKSHGIMPSASLYIAKVSAATGKPSHLAVRNALQSIFDQRNDALQIDVINMSFHLGVPTKPEEKPLMGEISDLVQKLTREKNCVIVGACGDHGLEFKAFPASLEECVSAGSISSQFIRWEESSVHSTLDVMAPGVDIHSSHGTDGLKPMSGTSQSTAFISGLCALGIHEMKKKIGHVDSFLLKKILYQTALNSGFPPHEYGHGICNPKLFIQTIKTLLP